MSSSSSSSSKNKQQREEIDDHHHVGGVHLGGRDYGVINDGGKTSGSQTNKEKDKTTFTNDKNEAEKNKFSDKTKNNWGYQNEKEESLPKTVQSHHNIGGVHIGGHNCGTITLDGNVYKPSESSQKPDKHGNFGRGDNNDDIPREEIDDHHHVGGVHLGGRDYGVINDNGKTSESQANKNKRIFSMDDNNAGMNSESSKNNWGQQKASKWEKKEKSLPKAWKSHDNSGGAHIGGRDYGVINDGGKKSESQTNKEKDKTTFTNDKDNAGMNFESSKNNWSHQSEREKEDALPKTVKSHHNSGGVHIGGSNYGSITVTGNKNESSKNSQKSDKYGNIGGYHRQGDNNDDIHYDGSH